MSNSSSDSPRQEATFESDENSLIKKIKSLESELAKKEKELKKVKESLTKTMRKSKRQETQVENLQMDLSDRTRKIESLQTEIDESRSFSSIQNEKIQSLELELAQTKERIQLKDVEAAQKRNEKMKQMFSKSQSMYAELEVKYQTLLVEKEKIERKPIGKPKQSIQISEGEVIVLYDDFSYSVQTSPPSEVSLFLVSKKKDETLLKYLKNVFLEFLISDGKTQVDLISVILKMLNCSSEQIEIAQKSFCDGLQLVSRF